MRYLAFSMVAVAVALAVPSAGMSQSLEGRTPPRGETVRGYLSWSSFEPYAELAPPAQVGSVVDREDWAEVLDLQKQADAARWEAANADAASIYPRFAGVFGGQIDRAETPRLIHLLNRVERDVSIPVFAAKEVFRRPRPFQRAQLTRVCGLDTPPPPDPDPKDRSSYPSGHSAYGWAAAMVLAQVAPDRSVAVLARGYDYGISRVICGVHYPSDVEAGRLIASGVFARLATNAAFRRDLGSARYEHQRILRRSHPLDRPAPRAADASIKQRKLLGSSRASLRHRADRGA